MEIKWTHDFESNEDYFQNYGGSHWKYFYSREWGTLRMELKEGARYHAVTRKVKSREHAEAVIRVWEEWEER